MAHRRAHIKQNFGMTLEEWDALFASQDFACAACRTPHPGGHKRWHTHHTGSKKAGDLKVHGILCHHCNITARNGSQDVINKLCLLVEFLKKALDKRLPSR